MDSLLPISKLFWFLIDPVSLLLFLWLAGSALLYTRWFGVGRFLTTFAALVTLANAMLPIGQMALQPIEDRFPSSTRVRSAVTRWRC